MTNQQYLQSLLDSQDLTKAKLSDLRALRDKIETQLRTGLNKIERVYYAGSFGKKTMIREQYDLDLVLYWANGCGLTLKELYTGVGNVLKENWEFVHPRKVGWELPFQGGLRVDVIPGRALNDTYKYANLYLSNNDSSLQTSIKVHIETVRNSGRRDAIRLIKLWRARNNVPFKKSLALELATIDGCSGTLTTDLEKQLLGVFRYLRDNILAMRLVDPANSNNVISDQMSFPEKQAIKQAAQAALDAQTWTQVF